MKIYKIYRAGAIINYIIAMCVLWTQPLMDPKFTQACAFTAVFSVFTALILVIFAAATYAENR